MLDDLLAGDLPPSRSDEAQTEHAVSIPGKVMLSGEYSVLHGGTAVLLPAARYLHLRRTGWHPKNREWDAGLYPPVVDAALRIYLPQVSENEYSSGIPEVEIDRSEFVATDAHGASAKLGLGSSAAEAVGTIALRYACAVRDWRAERDSVFRYALEVHETAQGGVGSGADVAACAYAQPLRFRRPARSAPEVELLPDDARPVLPLTLVWSGTVADSRKLVRRYLDWHDQHGEDVEVLTSQLGHYALRLGEAWFGASQPELFELLDVYAQAMEEVAEAAGFSWRLPAHARLEEWARRHGGRAKPTGAGGGDMVLLIGDLPVEKLKLEAIKL